MLEPLLVGLLAIVSAARRVAGCLEAKDCAMMHMHLGAGYRFYAASKGANDPHKASQGARGRSATHMSIDLQKAAERSARAARGCDGDGAMEGNLAWWESITNSANHESNNFIDPILKSHLAAA